MNAEFQDRIIVKIKRELGDEILNFLYDDETIEIMLNSDSNLWVEKLGQDMQCHGKFSESKAKSIIFSLN